jgi:hypothetical protein
MATDPPPHLSRAAATGAVSNENCVCCTQGRQDIHADYGSIPYSRTPVSKTYRSAFVAGKPKITLFVFIAFLSLCFYHAIDSLLENQCRSRVIRLTKDFESQLQEKDDLFAGVLQRRDQAFALEKANLTAEHHLNIVALTRKYEGRLQQKDDWVSGELRRKDRSLALERLQLAGETARLTEDKATLAAEWDRLFSREEAIRHEEDRQGRDVERRLRSNIHWGSLQRDDACVGWQKMLYSAELQGLPHDVDGVAWCQETSIDIYNTVFDKPDYCEKNSSVSSPISPSLCLTHHLVLLDAGSRNWTLDAHRRAILQHDVGKQGRLGALFVILTPS